MTGKSTLLTASREEAGGASLHAGKAEAIPERQDVKARAD
jgi:hypothetical protein